MHHLVLLLLSLPYSAQASHNPKPSYLYDTAAIEILSTQIEPRIYIAIRSYNVQGDNQPEGNSSVIQRYLRDYEECNSVAALKRNNNSNVPLAIVDNPILVHKLINRVCVLLPEITEIIGSTSEGAVVLHLASQTEIPLPTKSEDLRDSLTALLRIQRYNNYDARDMAEGTLGEVRSGISLSAYEAFDIGCAARLYGPMDLAAAVEWLELALMKADREEDEIDWTFRTTVQDELKEAVIEHDALCSTKVWNDRLDTCFTSAIGSQYYKNASSAIPEGRQKLRIKNQKMVAPHHRVQKHSGFTTRNFMSTCASNTLMSEAERAKLSCWYESRKDVYLKISPLKFERLSEAPEVVQIYDFLGPQKIKVLMEEAKPNMTRSLVVNDENTNDESIVRTSSQTWLAGEGEGTLSLNLNSISRQIEYATGLNVRYTGGSEDYQVARYRPSHHYDEHSDALQDGKRSLPNGDRIATFMIYLTNVEAGGKTGFPIAGVAANPIAGSAVFWHNLLKNGDKDKRTWHGGCPVAFGVKWVVTKWILHHQNFKDRPCSLNPKE